MRRDRDQQYIPDTFWLVVAALLFAACGLVWLIGQVAAIVFGPHHQHIPVRLVDMLGVLLRVPGTWDDPGQSLATLLPAAAAGPGGDVRRRHPDLLDPRSGLRAARATAVAAGSSTPTSARGQVGELVAAAPTPCSRT
jgi:hypothetical protein